MHVSERLLAVCGRSDLFHGPGGEYSNTDFTVVHDKHYAVARDILQCRRALDLPRDRRRLETKLCRIVS